MMGYDTLFFSGGEDSAMVAIALAENRVIITRDTQIVKRRLVTSGRLRVILITDDKPEVQLRQVVAALRLDTCLKPFSICLECNQPLVARSKEEVRERVPPYVFKPQEQYQECPACHRIYWRGSHWQAMNKKLESFVSYQERGQEDGCL